MRNKNYKVIMLGLALQIGVCFGLVFGASNEALAYTASITTNNNVTVDVSPASGGVSIQTESINVVSDCRNGYNLSIATPAGSDLYRYDNGTQASTASFTAVDGTSALSSDNNINKWGYTLADNPTGSMVFSPLSATSVALKTSTETASPSSDINDTFNINYGVKVDNSIAPGSYQMANQGAIVYYLTMDTACTQYMVSFNANGGTGTMVDQPLQEGEPDKINPVDFVAPAGASYTDADNNTITGDANKLWLFWGWNTRVDGTGDWYKDNEEVLNISSVGSTAILYAQWRQATLSDMTAGTPTGTEKVIDHNLMQDMRPEICYNSDITTAANAPAATLLDYRGKVITDDPNTTEAAEQYTVSKLPDGLCWMTANLNLGRNDNAGPNNNGTITLTSEDTDLAENTTFTLPKSTTTSSTTATAARIRTTNTSGNNNNGTYYSWAAAVASTTSTSGNPTTSVCPKNWDLPSNGQYSNLASKSSYSSSNSPMNAPSSFLAGKFTNGASFYPSSYNYGFYWSNTSSSNTAAYGARVTTSALTTSASTGTSYGGNKYYEKNVRCIASQGTITVYYDGNGTNEYPVTGSVAAQENAEINVGGKVQANGFAREGWAFKNWNTEPDGSGISISADANLTTLSGLKPGSIITLYAQWTPQYTITYVNNCRTYANTEASCTQTVSNSTKDQKINLNASGNGSGTLGAYNYNSWTPTGWKIQGWSTVADNSSGTYTEYPVSSTYKVTGASAGDSITLYAHWVPTYTIQYDGNTPDNPNGMGTTTSGVKSVEQTNVSESDPVTLLPSNFKKAGYGFAGWSTDANAWSHFTDNDNTNDPTIYGPMETISAPAHSLSANNILTMYAVWIPAAEDGNNNPIYLQDFGATECANLTSTTFDSTTGSITAGSVIALTDKRDNQVYTIAKLADNNCWMVENLRLDNQYTMGQNQNDPTVTNESLAQGYGGTPGTYGSFVGLANSEITDFISSTTANSIYKADGSGSVYNATLGTLEDIGTTDSPDRRFPRYNNNNTYNLVDSPTYTQNYGNAAFPINSGTNYLTSSNIYSYGNYYSWAAAMANTNYITTSSSSEAAGTSICPSGWHLPSSYSDTYGQPVREMNILLWNYGYNGSTSSESATASRLLTFPNNFVPSGLLYASGSGNSKLESRGSGGYYWSRTAALGTSGIEYANVFIISRTSVSPKSRFQKYTGMAIRCLVTGV